MFIQENALENVVYEIAPILSRRQCVKALYIKLLRNIKVYLYFLTFIEIEIWEVVKIHPHGKEGPVYLTYNQYHSCRWHGDVKSQGISCHDIDLIPLEHYGLSTIGIDIISRRKRSTR